MLIDCHSHIHVDAFDSDRKEVLQRARDAGVETLINVGFDVEGNFKAISLANQYDFIYATMGIHPHSASEWNEEIGERIIETVKKEPRVVALGEMGLDYFKNFQPRELQITVLRAQLAIAQKLELPVIIHCRDAFTDLFEILPQYELKNVLLHCFTGTVEEARIGWQRGYYMAFTGILTYPSAEPLRQVARECPTHLAVVETDCPYLPPVPHRGKRNEPAFLRETADFLASLRPDITHEVLVRNTVALFSLDSPPALE